jgi:hypothetical protein
MNAGRQSVRKWIWIALALLGLGLAAHALHYDYVVDDAFISFRYAQNLVDGEGLVFNPGERVEGYTNFLWVILMAAAVAAALDPVPVSQVLGLGAGLATLVLVFLRPPFETIGREGARLLGPVLLCLSPAFALWCVGGLETSLFTLLVFAGMALAVRTDGEPSGGRREVVSGFCLALACLTRPEGFLASMLVVIDRVIWPERARGTMRRFPFRWLAAWAVVVVPYEIWRWTYYGYLFPNSYYAKVGWGGSQLLRGFGYLGRFAAGSGGLALVLWLLGLGGGLKDRWTRVLYLWSLAFVGYVVAVGGDGLFMYRFFVPVLPALYLLAGRGVLTLDGWIGRAVPSARTVVAGALVLGLAVMTLLPTLGSAEKQIVERDRVFVERHWIPIGKWLRSYARPGESIAVTTAGAVPYYSGLYTIDMLGINESEIAHREMPGMGSGIAGHEKHDMDYVIRRRPTYLFHHLFLLTKPKFTREQFETPWNPGEERLLTSEVFPVLYEQVSEKVGPFYINFFRLRSSAGEPEK